MLRFSLLAVFFATMHLASAAPLDRQTLMDVAVESRNDNIPSGWCGRGILSILTSAGLGAHLKAGNGEDWEIILQQAGWKYVRCLSPVRAPLGSVLVYTSDTRLGKPNRGTPGGSFGHVEMVALGQTGSRLYVSDCPREKPGGSVPDNFTGRAWLPPGQYAMAKGPTVEEQTAKVLEERRQMAMAFFEARQARQQPAATLSLNTVVVPQP